MIDPLKTPWWRNPVTLIAVALGAVFVFTLARFILVPIFAGLAAVAVAVAIGAGIWLLLRSLKVL